VGILQINAWTPGSFVGARPVSVQLVVGTAVSPELTIWLE
jgi:hypothetical protein